MNAETLKKFEIAPNNETYILTILKFLKIIDPEGKKNATAAPLFHKNDDEFEPGFAKLVREAYAEVFETYGEDGWNTPASTLIAFFRTHDDTSEVVGTRQANTFRTLARLGGKVTGDTETTASKPKPAAKAKPATKRLVATPASTSALHPPAAAPSPSPSHVQQSSGLALTVRVEINLPPGGDQATYDAIFKSIRENLLNGNGA